MSEPEWVREELEEISDMLNHASREVDMARDAAYRRRRDLLSLHLEAAEKLAKQATSRIGALAKRLAEKEAAPGSR